MHRSSPAPVVLSVLALLALPLVAAQPVLAACNPNTNGPTFHYAKGTLHGKGGIDSAFLFAKEPCTITSPDLTMQDLIAIAYLPPAGATVAKAMVVLKSNCDAWDTAVCGANTVTYCEKTIFTPGMNGTDPTLTFDVPEVKENGVSRAGHVRLAATTGAIPCWLANPAQTCADAPTTGTHACIDVLEPVAAKPRSQINTVTALPSPKANDFSKLCDPNGEPPPHCMGNGTDLNFVVDAHGNLLIPMDWNKVISKAGKPSEACDPAIAPCDTREVTASTSLPRKKGQLGPISIPATDLDAVESFNLDGIVFDNPPQFVVVENTIGELQLRGDTDKPFSVLRIRRCPNGADTCDAAAAYFDVADRVEKGGGGKIPKTGKKSGYCDDGSNTTCSTQQCAANVPCVWVGGGAGKFKGPRPVPPTTTTTMAIAAAPPPPPPAPEPMEEAPPPPVASPPGSGGATFWLLAGVFLVAIVLIVVLKRRGA